MKKTQLSLLFLCSFVIWSTGNGLLPLLPVYANSLGANHLMIGVYLAVSYLCLALGSMAAGYITNRYLTHKSLIVDTGLMGVPLTLLMGWLDSIELLIFLTSVLWFLGGLSFSALNALVSELTTENSRGTSFSLIAIASPLGAIAGGLISGPVVDYWGFQTLFVVMALISLVWPLSISLLDTSSENLNSEDECSKPVFSPLKARDNQLAISGSAKLLLLASLSAFTAYFMGILGLSLSMDEQGFTATDIANTAVIGGAISLPFVYGIGLLSDLFGRKLFWCSCCFSGLLALWLLANAADIFTYCCVAVLLRIFSTGNRGLGTAWIDDLSRGLGSTKLIAYFGCATWLGGILGYMMTGYGFAHWGAGNTFDIALTFPVLAMLFVIPCRKNALR